MSNNTLRIHENQAPPRAISARFITDPWGTLVEHCSSLNIPARIFAKLVHLYLFKGCVRISREALRRLSGDDYPDCSTRTITRAVNFLIELGLLNRIQKYKQVNIYRINPFAITVDVIRKLGEKLSFFKKIHFAMLLGVGGYMGECLAKKVRFHHHLASLISAICIYSSRSSISNSKIHRLFGHKDPGSGYLSPPPYPSDTFSHRSVLNLEGRDMDLPRVAALSDDVKVHLAAFTPLVIEEALKDLDKQSGYIKNKVAWLRDRCTRMCEEQKIEPSWKFFYHLRDQIKPPEAKAISQIYKYQPKILASTSTSTPKVIKPTPIPRHLQNKPHYAGPVSEEDKRRLQMLGIWDWLQEGYKNALEKEAAEREQRERSQ